MIFLCQNPAHAFFPPGAILSTHLNPITIAIVLGLFGVIYLWTYFSEKRRREGVQKVVETLGFKPLSETHQDAIASALQGIPFFASCLSTLSVDNAFECEELKGFVAFADLSISQGRGRTKSHWEQTVMILNIAGANFPHFKLKPKTRWTPLRQAWKDRSNEYRKWDPPFALSDIRWNVLADAREWEKVGTVLTSSRLASLPQKLDCHMEVYGDWIFIYNPARRVKPDKLAHWIQSSRSLGNLFQP